MAHHYTCVCCRRKKICRIAGCDKRCIEICVTCARTPKGKAALQAARVGA